jgi:hypothetical protein
MPVTVVYHTGEILCLFTAVYHTGKHYACLLQCTIQGNTMPVYCSVPYRETLCLFTAVYHTGKHYACVHTVNDDLSLFSRNIPHLRVSPQDP